MTTRAAPPPTAPRLLTTHAHTLSTYRRALALAQEQLDALQTTITSLQTTLAETRADETFWRQRVQELDRLTRVQALELTAAKRGRREAEQECARVRVELEDVRRGIKRVRWKALGPVGVTDRETQTDDDDEEEEAEDVVREWVQHTGVLREECNCGAARAVRGLFRRPDDKGKGVEGRGLQSGGDRERRRVLREKLRDTKKRVDGMRERAGERFLEGEDWTTGVGIAGWRRGRGGGTTSSRGWS
ncbi:hypothetical protein K440DRAFT_637584 [Wilcoxina mikolae CBS 423.85]|nr:hypothetical protein K440DRAFT_637584 [Wilcoxina mikolae CBS 423.85]